MQGVEEELLEPLLPPKTLNMILRPGSPTSPFSFQGMREVEIQQAEC